MFEENFRLYRLMRYEKFALFKYVNSGFDCLKGKWSKLLLSSVMYPIVLWHCALKSQLEYFSHTHLCLLSFLGSKIIWALGLVVDWRIRAANTIRTSAITGCWTECGWLQIFNYPTWTVGLVYTIQLLSFTIWNNAGLKHSNCSS